MDKTSKPTKQTRGELTYALVDCDDGVWRWAIVQNYRGPQEFDSLLMAFAPEHEPFAKHVKLMLEALAEQPERRRRTGRGRRRK